MAIYSLLQGRIGNILFQVAAGASLAEELGYDYFIVPTDYNREYIKQFKDNLLKNVQLAESLPEEYFFYQQPNYHYDNIIVPPAEHIVLFGFFQSEKFFNPVLVRTLFYSDTDFLTNLYSEYKAVLDLNPVSINVRRGDYLIYPKRHPVCSLKYYRKAIHKIGKDNLFFVSSDDIAWCKKHFKGSNYYFYEGNNTLKGLYIQSLCSRHIVSNSSFSWWGAWLNHDKNKIVIAPDPWFGKEVKGRREDDLFPASWIKIKRKIPFSVYLNRDYLLLELKKTAKKIKQLCY